MSPNTAFQSLILVLLPCRKMIREYSEPLTKSCIEMRTTERVVSQNAFVSILASLPNVLAVTYFCRQEKWFCHPPVTWH